MTELSQLPPDQSDSFECLPNSQTIQEENENDQESESSASATATAIAEMTSLMSSPSLPLNEASPVLIITAAYDHTIRFWDVLQGNCLATLQHNESVHLNAATIDNFIKFFSFSFSKSIV